MAINAHIYDGYFDTILDGTIERQMYTRKEIIRTRSNTRYHTSLAKAFDSMFSNIIDWLGGGGGRIKMQGYFFSRRKRNWLWILFKKARFIIPRRLAVNVYTVNGRKLILAVWLIFHLLWWQKNKIFSQLYNKIYDKYAPHLYWLYRILILDFIKMDHFEMTHLLVIRKREKNK